MRGAVRGINTQFSRPRENIFATEDLLLTACVDIPANYSLRRTIKLLIKPGREKAAFPLDHRRFVLSRPLLFAQLAYLAVCAAAENHFLGEFLRLYAKFINFHGLFARRCEKFRGGRRSPRRAEDRI